MQTDKLDFLMKKFPFHKIVFSEKRDYAEIINPFNEENIIVDYIPEDEFTPFLCRFSYQHRHFKSEEYVVEYINNIMSKNIYAIEFFENGENRFGWDITLQELSTLSYEYLEQRSGYYGVTKLKDVVDSFKVRGWDPCNNFDAIFVEDECGKTTLLKLKEI